MKLSVKGLRRIFTHGEESRRALVDITLSIESGEFVAIMGRSGSGKTTLLNAIGGLDTRFEGEVRLGEKSLREMSEAELASFRHRHLGFVFQSYNLLNHLTVLENVLLPSYFGPLRDGGDPLEVATGLLDRVGLGDRLRSRPTELSGGQRQRVAIARALLCRPSVLLCDEPTGSLDRATGLTILQLFEELNREDEITVVLVTHEPHVAAVARRKIRLDEGRIASDQEQEPRWPVEGEGAPPEAEGTP